jgi:N-acetylmuramoyl-L-alanine amidase
LHFNSSDDSSATGTEVLLPPGKPAAAALATAIARSLKDTLGLRLRGNQGLNVLSPGARGWISVTALPDVPSVLCEPFFGSNPGDCLAVGTVGDEGLAIAYLRALREFVVGSNLTS